MTRHLFAAVERNIDRGATKLREQVITATMRERARKSVIELIGAERSRERKIQAIDALIDAASDCRVMVDDPEGLLAKLGSVCGRYAPEIDLRQPAKARAESVFRKAVA